MKNNKKTVIKLICALVVLVIAIVALVLVTKKLNNENASEGSSQETSTQTIAGEGEGTYLGNMLLMYPEIEKSSISTIKIKTKDGEVELVSRMGDTGKKTLRLKSYPAIRCSDGIANNIYSAMCVPLVRYNSNKEFYVYRNVTEQERIEKGVTPEACTVEYEISFKDENGNDCSYTVYVGNKTFLNTSSYYAMVKGREDTIYIIDSLVESFFNGSTEEFYVSPVIYSGTNITDTMFLYEDFSINKFKGASMITQTLGIHAKKTIVPGESINVEYRMMYPLRTSGLRVDNDYMSSAFTKLLVSFVGDSVMVLEPTEEDLARYGFGKDDEFFVVQASQYKQTDDEEEVADYVLFTISEEIDGYYYVYNESQGRADSLDYIPDTIVRVPKETLSFIEEENLIRWVATNSLETNFYQSISANEAEGKIGVKEMSIMMNNILIGNDKTLSFDDTFNIEYSVADDEDGRKLRVWLDNNKNIEFVDKEVYESVTERNQFNNFYANLLNYPMPYRFNEMTEEQIANTRADKNNLVFSLHVELNDGTKLTYDYYRIDGTEYVMCEFTDETFTEPTVVFDVKMEHVILLAQSLDQLMSGQTVETK